MVPIFGDYKVICRRGRRMHHQTVGCRKAPLEWSKLTIFDDEAGE